MSYVKKCTLSRKYHTIFGSKSRSVAQLGIWDFWHCLQFMCENSLTLIYVHRFPGEPKLVSGPWCIPEAACSAVQLPGGRWTHQPSHDPGHACHESPQGWFTASTPVRSLDQIENQWQVFINKNFFYKGKIFVLFCQSWGAGCFRTQTTVPGDPVSDQQAA